MLKITNLKNAVKALTKVVNIDSNEVNEIAYEAVCVAYATELAKARDLEVKYYSVMNDVKYSGLRNANDTYPVTEFGTDISDSSEYWTCAIETVVMLRDYGHY